MLITELINHLTLELKIHGDIPVFVYSEAVDTESDMVYYDKNNHTKQERIVIS